MPAWNLDHIVYGGDYNPEQWDEATVAADIALMQEAGVNLVTLGVFSWARLEPKPGDYQLDWLLTLLDQLHAAGIDVDLATGTASPPAWLALDYPETLPVTATGVRLGFGSRQQYCPTSPEFREAAAKLVGQLAHKCGTHPAVKLWHISNEYGCHIAECFCERCATHFQDWLLKRYGDINAINRAWGTAFWSQEYTGVEQIQPPRAMPTFHNPAQALDWQRFSSDTLLELFCLERDILRGVSPQVPITTNFMGVFPRIDYWKWAQEVDIVSDDSYPDPADPAAAAIVALEGDLMRSLKQQPFLLMEQSPSAVQWRPLNSPKRPGVNELHSLERIGHGADGILHFQWRQSVRGSETFHAGMVPHAGRDSRIFKEVVQLGRDLEKLAPVVGEPYRAQVALLWDWESEWARQAAIGPRDEPWALQLRRWHRTLFEAGYQADIVNPGAKDFSAYKLLIVPALFALSSETLQRLYAAAAAGAQVLVAAPTAYVDHEVAAYTDSYQSGLTELTGMRLIEPWPATVDPAPQQRLAPELWDEPHPLVDRVTAVVTANATQAPALLYATAPSLQRALEQLGTPAPDLQAQSWAELAEPAYPGVEVLAQYTTRGFTQDLAGQAAITRNPIGRGACIYSSADLDALGRAVLVRLAAAHARIQPVLADLPAGVHASVRGDYLFLTNHSDKTVELSGIVGQLLLAGQAATGHIALAPRSGEVVYRGSLKS